MKKLLLLGIVLLTLCACSKDDTDSAGNPSQKREHAPHFYGWMTLDDPAPETRGVANGMKLWSKPVAKNHLTVKFLNGTDRNRQLVKDLVKEWEKYADVKFHFVSDDKDAVVRVGFDYVRGMSSSWALTGTDHMQKYGNQDEATVHFAWRRASDAVKRSDVLRAFGQVLGLELEFRHPDFDPEWITDADGNIDEPTIREYWEAELNELISWEELRKVVLEPLSKQTFMIEKTKEYDSLSVMCWPFFDEIASKLPIIECDDDHNTELSEQDKAFIQQLYGEQTGSDLYDYVKLVTFDFTGQQAELTLTTEKDLVVIWEEGAETAIEIPYGTTTLHTETVSHKYADSKSRKIIIGEIVEYGEDHPTESTALRMFDLVSGGGMENLDLNPEIPNTQLSYIRIQGNKSFKAQQLNFTGNKYLKELYLTNIGDSKVLLENCPNLEVFATSDNIWQLDLEALGIGSSNNVQGVQTLSDDDTPNDDLVISSLSVKLYPILIDPKPILNPIRPWHPVISIYKTKPWPCDPQQNHSLCDEDGAGLTIRNCPKLKMLSLENTRIKTLNTITLANLEYLYISSTPEYIVGCGNAPGANLRVALLVLRSRKTTTPGQVIIRGIKYDTTIFPNSYLYSPVTYDQTSINTFITNRNWAVCWDPTFEWDASSSATN